MIVNTIKQNWKDCEAEIEILQSLVIMCWAIVFFYPSAAVWDNVELFRSLKYLGTFKIVFSFIFFIVGLSSLLAALFGNRSYRIYARTLSAAVFVFLSAAFLTGNYFDTPIVLTAAVNAYFCFKTLRRISSKKQTQDDLKQVQDDLNQTTKLNDGI